MDELTVYMNEIRNEAEYLDSAERLKTIYKEIVRLIVKKEEYEKLIDDYLRNKNS